MRACSFAFSTAFLIAFLTAATAFSQKIDPQKSPRWPLRPVAFSELFELENLAPGQPFSIHFSADETVCPPALFSLDPDFSIQKSLDDPRRFDCFSKSSTAASLRLDFCPNEPLPTFLTISFSIEKGAEKAQKAQLSASKTLNLVITPGIDPTTAIKEILIGGDCFDVQNVQFLGNGAFQLASFSGGAASLGFDEGLFLSTGFATNAPGPNDSNGSGGNVPGDAGSDPDLQILAGGGAFFDRAVLDFEFKPNQSTISFEYVFASEEYCEFVHNVLNVSDMFGFFVSGPGFAGPFSNGAINVATLPSTTTSTNIVAIDNVNHLDNPAFFRNGNPNLAAKCAPAAPADPILEQEIQFDGLTTVLTATLSNLVPCQTYRIKLKIADRGDAIIDSGVFLRKGSFGAGGKASATPVVASDPTKNEAREACETAGYWFERQSGDLNLPLVVPFSIAGTATSGTDFVALPPSVTIPAGQNEFFLPVSILADGLPEGLETIILTLANPCNCSARSCTLVIRDLAPLVLQPLADQSSCGPVALAAQAIGGASPYLYDWSNGASGAATTALASGFFAVTATDGCGQTATAGAEIEIFEAPKAAISGSVETCSDGPVSLQIPVEIIGNGPFELVFRRDGELLPTVWTAENSFIFETEAAQKVELLEVWANGCAGDASGVFQVIQKAFSIAATAVDPRCAGEKNGSISLAMVGGAAPFSFKWSQPGAANSPVLSSLGAGAFSATVTDASGCSATADFLLNAPPPLVAVAQILAQPNCSDEKGGAAEARVFPSLPSVSFLWSNGEKTAKASSLGAGDFFVIASDEKGCTASAGISIAGNFEKPTANATAIGQIDCLDPTAILSAAGSSSGAAFSAFWTGENFAASGSTAVVQKGGSYQLLIKNEQNGCFSADSVRVFENFEAPKAEAVALGELTCSVDSVEISAVFGSSVGSDFLLEWSGAGLASDPKKARATVAAPGFFTLKIRDLTNGCSATDSVFVAENRQKPNAQIARPDTLSCRQTTAFLDGRGSFPSDSSLVFAWLPASKIVGSSVAAAVETASAGLFSLLLTDSKNGCTTSATVEVFENFTRPTALAGPDATIDCGQTAVEIGFSTASGDCFFEWKTAGGAFVGPNDGPTVLASAAGFYILTATEKTSGCTASDTVLVAKNVAFPLADAGETGFLTCEKAEIQLAATASGGPFSIQKWTTSDGQIVAGGDGLAPRVAAPGRYFFEVRDTATGCASGDSVDVFEDKTPPVAVAAALDSLDCSTQKVRLSAFGSSVGAGFSAVWSAGLGGFLVGDSMALEGFAGAAGDYFLTVKNSKNGCSATASARVEKSENLPILTIFQPKKLDCRQFSTVLDASASVVPSGFLVEWASAGGAFLAGQSTLFPTVAAAGEYVLTVKNSAGDCASTASVFVEKDATPPTAEAGDDQILDCKKLEATLGATAFSSDSSDVFEWTTAGGAFVGPQNLATAAASAAGVYFLKITSAASGCEGRDTVQIFENRAAPTVEIEGAGDLTCREKELVLRSKFTQNLIKFWATSDGQIVGPTDGWEARIATPGTYFLSLENPANGCSATASAMVGERKNWPQIALAEPELLTCSRAMVELRAEPFLSTQLVDYQWITMAGTLVGATDSADVLAAEKGVYRLAATDRATGCAADFLVEVFENRAAPTVSAGADATIGCEPKTAVLTASATPNFTQILSKIWASSDGEIVGAADDFLATVGAPGRYFFTATDAGNGCAATDSADVFLDVAVPSASIFSASTLTCKNGSVRLDASGSSLPMGSTFSWSGPSGAAFLSGSETLEPTVGEAGFYSILIENGQNGCVSTAKIEVFEDLEKPVAEAKAVGELNCSSEKVRLEAGSGSSGGALFSAFWSGSGAAFLGQNPAAATAAGLYFLTVENLENGCRAVDSVVVLPLASGPTGLEIRVEPPFCAARTGRFFIEKTEGGAAPFLFSTDGGATFLADTAFKNVAPGWLEIEVEDANGCRFSQLLEMPEAENLTIEMAPELFVELGENAFLEVILPKNWPFSAIDTVIWSPSSGLDFGDFSIEKLLAPTVVGPTERRVFKATVVAQNGCQATAQTTVRVDRGVEIFVPNALSGDGENGRLAVFADPKTVADVEAFEVFDRWGGLVFSARHFAPNEPIAGWDTAFLNIKTGGVFVFWAKIRAVDGRVFLRKGDLTVVR